MAYITKQIYAMISNVYEEHKDPRVLNLPLLGSPLPMAISIAVYLAFVLHYGPKWMANRKPYNLKYIMRIYNAIQVIANLMLLFYGFKFSYFQKEFSFTCQPVDHTNTKPYMMGLLYTTYGYYLTKYLDLLDTVFFILRKKNNQITFLHVYHHAGMVFAVYVFMTFFGGSHGTMLGVINCLVHTIMYLYYFITSVRPIERALWWKRYITQLQLLQFGYLMVHFLIVILHNPCQHPPIVAFVGLTQNLFMFMLFFDFYYKAYVKKTIKSNIIETKTTVTTTTTTTKMDNQHNQKQQQQQQQQQSSHIENNWSKSSNTMTTTRSSKSKFV